jgi:hypothetical protein
MSAGKGGRWLAVIATLVVVATVIAAMLTMGSPGEQREAKMDRKREQDMQRIVMAIDSRAEAGKPLPAYLASLAGEPGRRLAINDPANGTPYAYQTTGADSYRVCAVFSTDTASSKHRVWVDEEWLHGPGQHCFDRKLKRKK